MLIEFSNTNIFSVAVISIIVSFSAYNFFIYCDRERKEKIGYIYFALLALAFTIYLVCVTDPLKFMPERNKHQNALSIAITGIAFFLTLEFARKILKIILNFQLTKNKFFLPYFLSCLIYGILLSTFLFLDFEFCIEKIFPMIVTSAIISVASIFGTFIIYIYKEKPNDDTRKLILMGLFIFILNFTFEELSTLLNIYYPSKGTYFLCAISFLFWARAFAKKVNNENKNYIESTLIERTKELETTVENRTKNFVKLAHEVRTPLTLISNYVDEQIKNHGLTSETEIIKENTERLVRDISNFFTEEKFRKGIINFDHTQIINLTDFVNTKIELFLISFEKKKLKLETNIHSRIYIKADPVALGSLVNNLVENSIKYTNEGGTIIIKLEGTSEKILFTIEDNGKGINVESQSRIFEPYFQDNNQNTHGLGIGLSIVNHIVNSLNGKIYLKSKENQGTKFCIEFTRYHLKDNDKVVQNHFHQQPFFNSCNKADDILDMEKKQSVLIIEDNTQLLNFLAVKFSFHFNVYVAENGKQALNKLKNIPKPILIISDIMMDEVNGYDFLEEISKSTFNSIPLIFITARTTDDEKLKGLKMGAVDVIFKPFKMNELISKSISIMNKNEQQKHEIVNSISEFLEKSAGNIKSVHANIESPFNYNCYYFNISPREKEIIAHISNGCTYKEIAEKLFISENTVAKHVQNIYEKTGTKNKVELLGRMNKK